MDFGAVEEEIAEYLKGKIADENLTIIPIPENEIEVLPQAGKRQIIVAFASEDSDGDGNLSYLHQDVTIVFSILLQGKMLRGEKGLYSLAETIKLHMIGFTPTRCREMVYSSHKFVQNDKKIFEYVLDFKTETTRVAATKEPEPEGQINQVTYYSNEKV